MNAMEEIIDREVVQLRGCAEGVSVVLMGMWMPGTCIDCDLYDKHYRHGMCKGHGVLFGPEDDWKYETRPNWCPLRPLPDKHGRLIDADELADGCDDPHWCRWLSEIEDMPTIVEAEGD